MTKPSVKVFQPSDKDLMLERFWVSRDGADFVCTSSNPICPRIKYEDYD